MISDDKTSPGMVYVCPLCGAELAVIRGGGPHRHYCCNVPMDLVDRTNKIFMCPVCGSELMAINEITENLEPVCCNKPMVVAAA